MNVSFFKLNYELVNNSHFGEISRVSQSDLIFDFLATSERSHQVENNYYVMALDHPSKPKKTSMSTVFVLIISSLLGFVIGFIYVIIRNAIFKYKNLMSKDNK